LSCVVVFAIYNSNSVRVDYIIGFNDIPLALLLAMTLILGSTIGLMISLIKYIKLKRENISLKHNIKLAHKEINNLRELPLKDSH
tara:strand:- start:7518 stop:7772 length:255 start_codon:yes stop_codon:yes gene_type:complete